MSRFFMAAGLAGALIIMLPFTVDAHGIVGERFFPATITTDDPFAADELALPTVSHFRFNDAGTPTTETAYEMEYSKTILPGFAISVEGGYVHSDPQGGPSASGFDNIEITPTLEVLHSNAHEFITSVALGWEIGGSGSDDLGVDSASSFTPKLLFGKGLGDLPDNMALLRPLAVTGTVGYVIPGHAADPHAVEWGGAIEYSLPYLQANVRDAGLGSFWSRVTPLVEFSFTSPTDRNGGGTTGTINPGFLWSGQSTQLGIEAMIPLNDRTGNDIGAIAQLHFYLDDIFPHSLGRPLFR